MKGKLVFNLIILEITKKIKQACDSGKYICVGYSSNISGEIPRGYASGWFTLDYVWYEPKEETKSYGCVITM